MLTCHSNFSCVDYMGEKNGPKHLRHEKKTLQFCIDDGRCSLNAV